MAFMIDPLSAVMILVVTGIGGLIHIYSTGYMHDDNGFWRFFAYLNLFTFAMLMLVLGDSLLLLFVGWEGVGLVLLRADRLLVPGAANATRRQQGVHRQPRRRLRLCARACFCCSGRSMRQGHGTLTFREMAKWAAIARRPA